MVQMISLINILNCLPPLIFVLKHICMRLTILTGSKNNHKWLKLCSSELAVDMHPLDCKYTKMMITSTTCMRKEGERGSVEKEDARVKRAGHYY